VSAAIGRFVCVVRPGGKCRVMVTLDDGVSYVVTAPSRAEAFAQLEQRLGRAMDVQDMESAGDAAQ